MFPLAKLKSSDFIFSIPRLLTIFQRCLQVDHLDHFIFVDKNSPFHPCVGCLKLIGFVNDWEEKFVLTMKLDV
jgi:hypothetical protein